MARTRNLKPGFFTNDRLAEIPPLGRLLFQGLWCHADRAGRLQDRPRKLKAEIIPYDDCDVDALLNELAQRDFIVRYVVNQEAYIQIVKFSKHQNPHVKEGASEIPAPGSHRTSTIQDPEEPEPTGPSTLTLNPSTSNGVPTTALTCKLLYQCYPKQVGKGAAIKAIEKAVERLMSGEADLPFVAKAEAAEWLRERILAFARSPAGQRGEFTPHPSTWFNQGRYLDDEAEWHVNGKQELSKTAQRTQRNRETLIAAFRENRAEAAGSGGADTGEGTE